MNLFDTQTLSPPDLFKGDICYYADGHAVESQLPHLLQVTKVVTVTSQSIILDNGRKFSLESGEEVTRGAKGVLYPYTYGTIAMVTEAQQKLSLLNEVESIDFSTLTAQQLSMIRDVARGAFTQVTMSSPCGGGCGEDKGGVIDDYGNIVYPTVQVAGIDVDISSHQPLVPPFKFDPANPPMVMDAEGNVYNPDGSVYIETESPEVTAPIAFNDATYELTPSEVDALHETDDEDDNYDDEEDTDEL